jgi:hypothetical protein
LTSSNPSRTLANSLLPGRTARCPDFVV